MATRQRRRWIRLRLPSAIVYALLMCVTVAFTVARALPVWAAVGIAVALLVALFIPVRGRVLLVEWITVVSAYLRRRRVAVRRPLPAAADISVLSGDAGIRWDGYTLVAVVEVAPTVALTRESAGHAVSQSALPLDLVASLMTQFGLTLDIDVVSSGSHVPPGTAYRTVYSQLVGPRPVIGVRRTWLVLRLNVADNLAVILERGPSRTAAPAALAAAAHRVVQRLNQERIRAHALSTEQLDEIAEVLLAPIGGTGTQTRELWSVIRSGPSFVTSYLGIPELMADGQLDRWWSWRTEDTVVTIRLTGADRTRVGVLVRYVHHGKAYRPLPEAKLALPTGVQRALLTAALPAGDQSIDVAMPTVEFAALRDVRIPIGPSGQILGQLADGTVVAVPLWDQSGEAQRRRIDAQVGTELARQLVLRAVVTGAVIAIHTDDRNRWDELVSSVNDETRLFYATAGARHCDVAVFDGRPVTTVPARTVLRLLGGEARAAGADLTLIERPGQRLEIILNAESEPVVIQAIRTREEDRYLGLHQDEAPRRVVSTEPMISRSRRAVPPTVQAPAGPGPAVVPMPGAGPRGDQNCTVTPGPTRGRELAVPQRVARQPRPANRTPARPPRDFRLPSGDSDGSPGDAANG